MDELRKGKGFTHFQNGLWVYYYSIVHFKECAQVQEAFYSLETLSFAASGNYNGSLWNVGNNGNFWSPVNLGFSVAFNSAFGASDYGYVSSSTSSDHNNGFSVRCLAR